MDMGSCYVNSLAPEIAIRYQEKLQLFCDNIDPYSLDQSECSTSVEDLPNITGHQIKSYLMLSKCPYSGRAMGEKSATLIADYTDPERSGWVSKICVKNREDIAIVLGEVQILETGEFLSPWFVSFPYGYVLCAHCTCTAGINEMCIHIGGLMHRVQTLKEDARLQSGLSPAIPIPDRTVPVPSSRLVNRSTSDDDIATKILLNFINGKKGLGPLPRATPNQRRQRRVKPKMKEAPRSRRPMRVEREPPVTDPNDELSVGQRKRRNRVKLYVCGICTAQFADKESFMSHCQKLHVLPANAAVGSSPPPLPPPPKQTLEATMGPENVAVKAMKQLAILMHKDALPAKPNLKPNDSAETVVQRLASTEDEEEMVELIPVPDYDEDDDDGPLDAGIEVEIVPESDPDLMSIKMEPADEEATLQPDTPIKSEPVLESDAHITPVATTFIVTTIKQEPEIDIVDEVLVPPPPTASRTKTRSKSAKTTPTAPPVTRRSAPKVVFTPTKPTTRSSQKLITPVRKSLRTVRKNRSC